MPARLGVRSGSYGTKRSRRQSPDSAASAAPLLRKRVDALRDIGLRCPNLVALFDQTLHSRTQNSSSRLQAVHFDRISGKSRLTRAKRSPLACGINQIKAKDPRAILNRVAALAGKTEAQIVLNWCISRANVVDSEPGNLNHSVAIRWVRKRGQSTIR
jgi:hypothetical protein